MTAAQRRTAVDQLTDRPFSQRRACRLVGLPRSVAWYRLKGRDDAELRHRLKVLAERYPRYGYLTLHEMLKQEGRVINRKRTRRVYREEGLQVRTKRRKKITRPRVPMPVPTKANERWSADSMSGQLANGRRFRILNLIDDFSRQCVGQIVDTSISGARLARYLDELSTTRPLPRTLVLDNGPEFTSKAMFCWARRTGVRLRFIQPGKPTQNAFVESFNGKFRECCLDLHWFGSLAGARAIIQRQCGERNGLRAGGRRAGRVMGRKLRLRPALPRQCRVNLVVPGGRLLPGPDGGIDGAGLDNLKQGVFNGIVHAKATKGDAAGLAVVQRAPVAGILGDAVGGPALPDRQLASAAPAAHQAGQQPAAVPGVAMMPAGGYVAADHCAYRLGAFPVNIPLVGTGLQRQPLVARPALVPDPNARLPVHRDGAALAVCVGSAVDGVDDHSMDRGVPGPTPPSRRHRHQGAAADLRKTRGLTNVPIHAKPRKWRTLLRHYWGILLRH